MSHIKRVFFQQVRELASGASVRQVLPAWAAPLLTPEPKPITVSTTVVAGHGHIPAGAQVHSITATYTPPGNSPLRVQVVEVLTGRHGPQARIRIPGAPALTGWVVPVAALRSISAFITVTVS